MTGQCHIKGTLQKMVIYKKCNMDEEIAFTLSFTVTAL
jgi:hypothetical protein